MENPFEILENKEIEIGNITILELLIDKNKKMKDN